MLQPIPERVPEIQDRRLDHSYRIKDNGHKDLSLTNTIGDAGETFQGDTVIDLACNCGEKTFELSKYFKSRRVIGVDIDPESIAIAQRKYAPLVTNLEFHVADAYELSRHFSDIDLIMCQDAIHHFDDLDRLTAEVAATLRPEGHFMGRDFDRTRIYEVLEKYKQTSFYERLLELRAEKTDIEFMTYIVKKGLLGMKRKEVLLVMSLMASYTHDEFAESLTRNGFKGAIHKGGEGTYNFAVQKPELTFLQKLKRKIKKS